MSNDQETDTLGRPVGERAEGNQWKDCGKEINLANGDVKTISPDRYERIEHVGRRLLRGDTLKDIQQSLEEYGFDEVSYRQVQKDSRLLKDMQNAELRNKLFFENINDLVQHANEAQRELYEVLEDEKEKPLMSETKHGDSMDSHARIKAVKSIFNIQKDMVKTLQKLGMDLKRAELMEDTNDDVSDKDVTDIDDEIKDLIPDDDDE